jgi:hypothetical protein
MNDLNIVEIPSLFQNKITKRFTFTHDGINIEKLLSFEPPVFIPSENINAFRFRVVLIRGYRFVIGRQFVIETKDFDDNVFQKKLKTFYGIKRKTYYQLWIDIFDQLWDNYFNNMLNYYIDLYNVQQVFELAGVQFLTEGISWDKKNKLLWKEIALSNYRTYFMIHHVDNPLQHKSCSFSMDWNAFVLQCLLKNIVQQHK